MTATLAALLLTTGAARAQTTPEALIGQCPSMPPVATLTAWMTDPDNAAARQAVDDFLARIQALNQKGNEAADRMMPGIQAAAMSDADRMARQQTGKSIAEIQAMSDSQLEAFAKEQTAAKMASTGFGNMSLAQLQALEGKSDTEIMKALNITATTGLTPAELKAMEKMNEKQAEAYLKQGDRMQRMQAAAANAPQPQTQAVSIQAVPTAELAKIKDRWAEIDRLVVSGADQAAAKIVGIMERYQPQIDAIKPTGRFHDSEIFTDSEARARDRLISAMYSECYTLWTNHVSDAQGRIKTKLADVPRYDELQAQIMSAGGGTASAKVMPSIGYAVAGQYLDVTSGVTTLPRM